MGSLIKVSTSCCEDIQKARLTGAPGGIRENFSGEVTSELRYQDEVGVSLVRKRKKKKKSAFASLAATINYLEFGSLKQQIHRSVHSQF